MAHYRDSISDDEPTVELPDYDPQHPLLGAAAESSAQRFRWQKGPVSQWASLAARVVGAIAVVLLSVTLWRVVRHKNDGATSTPLPPSFFSSHNSQRLRIRYGPFAMPAHSMLAFETPAADFAPPCKDCVITWLAADLEHVDGTTANADTGMWLHHTLLVNVGATDTRGCEGRPWGERFFAAGNERSVVDLCRNGTEKSGYRLPDIPRIVMATELMNDRAYAQDAYVSITYEFIPGQPVDFKTVRPVWLDVGRCNDSEVPVPEDAKMFEFTSTPWKGDVSGTVSYIVSHVHDGGVVLETRKGSEVMCEARARYGESEGYVDGGMSHVSSIESCSEVGRMEVGEEWTVVASYDFEKYTPMGDGMGGLEPVMGIAIVYVVED